MSAPLDAVAEALYEAHRQAWRKEWQEVPAAVRTETEPFPADWEIVTPLDRRVWIETARMAVRLADSLVQIAKVPT